MDVVVLTAIALKLLFTSLAILLVWSLWKLRNASHDNTDDSIPGPTCEDVKLGNQRELAEAGSLPQLLETLHGQYGPIVKFHLGPQLFVSLASAELLDQQSRLFDRPYEVFALFEPLITRRSLQYANKEDGLTRRNKYDRHFSHAAMNDYEDTVAEEGDKMCRKWREALQSEGADMKINLQSECVSLSLRSLARCCFGEHFKDEETLGRFRASYEIVWNMMEACLVEGRMMDDSHPHIEQFRAARNQLYEDMRLVIKERKVDLDQPCLFVDYLVDYWQDEEDMQMLEALIFLIGGFHTTGYALVYTLYFLALHPNTQEKLHEEVCDGLKTSEDEEKVLSWKSVSRWPYVRACIDESLRLSRLAPFAARISEEPLPLKSTDADGERYFTVPANTPIIHALGVAAMDSAVFQEPDHFRPERFLGDNLDKCAFQPFGVGRRKCPGYRLAYMELSLWLVQIISQFRVTLADPGKDLEKMYGLVVKPKDDIFVCLHLLPNCMPVVDE